MKLEISTVHSERCHTKVNEYCDYQEGANGGREPHSTTKIKSPHSWWQALYSTTNGREAHNTQVKMSSTSRTGQGWEDQGMTNHGEDLHSPWAQRTSQCLSPAPFGIHTDKIQGSYRCHLAWLLMYPSCTHPESLHGAQ